MRLFSSRAKTKWLARSHIIRKNLKDKERSLLNDTQLCCQQNPTSLKLCPKAGSGEKLIYGISPSDPLIPVSMSSSGSLFSSPTENVFSRFLEQFDTPHPRFYIPPLFFTPSPTTAYCLWMPQEFGDKVPLPHPHPSWPPWKVYPPISCKPGESHSAFFTAIYLEEDRGPSIKRFNGESYRGNRSIIPTVWEGLNGAVTWKLFQENSRLWKEMTTQKMCFLPQFLKGFSFSAWTEFGA